MFVRAQREKESDKNICSFAEQELHEKLLNKFSHTLTRTYK